MNFSLLSQFLGISSASGLGLQGAAQMGAAAQGDSKGSSNFAALLQAMGLAGTPAASAVNGQNSLAPSAAPQGKSQLGSLIAPDPAQAGAPADVAAALAALNKKGEIGDQALSQLAQLGQLIEGEGSAEDLAAFQKSPLGQLLQSRPELKTALKAMLFHAEAPGDLPPALPENVTEEEIAGLAALVSAIEAAEVLNDAKTAMAPPAAVGEASEHTQAGTQPEQTASPKANAQAPEQTAGPVMSKMNSVADGAPKSEGMAVDNAAASQKGTSSQTASSEGAEQNPASNAQSETPAEGEAETIRTAGSAAGEPKEKGEPQALAPDMGDATGNDDQLAPQPSVIKKASQNGKNAVGSTAQNDGGDTAKPAAAGNAGANPPATPEKNRSADAGLRRPAQTTAMDVLASIRSDWGSGLTDGWSEPADGGVPGLGGVSAVSAATPAAAKGAVYMTPYTPAAQVAGQVALQISRAVKDGADSFQIRLDPPELGRVDVKLEIGHDGRVNAVVAVDNEKTLQLLMRDQGLLERSLQEAGLKTDGGSLNFSLNSQEGQRDRSDGFSGTAGRNGSRSGAGGDGEKDAQLPPPVVVSNRALDLRV